jgi:hypothetical protein
MKAFKASIYILLSFIFYSNGNAQNRWILFDDGISWTVGDNDAHADHFEMDGKNVALITDYGTDGNGVLICKKEVIFPMLRTIPNDTHASLHYIFDTDVCPVIKINGTPVTERPKEFYIKGILTVLSDIGHQATLQRILTPSIDKPLVIEKFMLKNEGEKAMTVDVGNLEKRTLTDKEKGVYGIYEIKAKVVGAGIHTVLPKETLEFAVIYSGKKESSKDIVYDYNQEIEKRDSLVSLMMTGTLQFVSPDSVINRLFSFSKIRAMEAIFETKNGYVHSPGGGPYYAAIWANDQAEYANPFFAYTGYNLAIESAMTSWKWFSNWMNPEYKPIPSSIIAEGEGFWNGAGDRGDQAMIAYGASRFALTLGDKEKAKTIWPLIEWCIEYSKSKINRDGVVESDSDELEGRFPSGNANLFTSCLLYDALNSAIFLGKELDISPNKLLEYKKLAEELRSSINSFFGDTIDGYETYRYYEGNNTLRSWICLPLTVDIFDRAKGTIDALLSPNLWTKDGLLTEAGSQTFWDRSTLYGFRGAFAAGALEKAFPYFIEYSNRRLLGDHVPYAIEAWPEGNQRHLSAESALYCRVIVEGLFGFRPSGLDSFYLRPYLPNSWEYMKLENVTAFGGRSIDINVIRKGKKLTVEVNENKKTIYKKDMTDGDKIEINLPE